MSIIGDSFFPNLGSPKAAASRIPVVTSARQSAPAAEKPQPPAISVRPVARMMPVTAERIPPRIACIQGFSRRVFSRAVTRTVMKKAGSTTATVATRPPRSPAWVHPA